MLLLQPSFSSYSQSCPGYCRCRVRTITTLGEVYTRWNDNATGLRHDDGDKASDDTAHGTLLEQSCTFNAVHKDGDTSHVGREGMTFIVYLYHCSTSNPAPHHQTVSSSIIERLL